MAYGTPAATAAAYAIAVHLVLWLPLTAVGILLLLLGGRPLQRIRASREWARQQG